MAKNLKMASRVCCWFIVTVNIVAMIVGIVLTLLGCLFTFGFALLGGTVSNLMSGIISYVTGMLKTSFNVDVDVAEMIKNLGQMTGSMGAVFLIIGICLVAIAGFGCCGACCSSNACLLVYTVAVGTIIAGQGSLVSVWYVNNDLLKLLAKEAMFDSLRKYTGLNSMNIQSLVQNLVHVFVGCCGVDNGTDFYKLSPEWVKTQSFNRSGRYFIYNTTYPLTCCKFNLTSHAPIDEYCSYNNTNVNTSWYKEGCYTKIFAQIDQYFKLSTIFLGLGGIIGIQVLLAVGAGIIMTYLARKRKVQPM